jgi:hypothetical protein
MGPQAWMKSTFSPESSGCVEVMFAGGAAHVRNTRDRQGPVLVFNRGEWEAFLLGTFNGEFEMPA